MDNIDAQITESVVFSILGHKKVGPQLFGVFPGGRLEEYIKVTIFLILQYQYSLYCVIHGLYDWLTETVFREVIWQPET